MMADLAAVAILTARLGDLLAEARTELAEEDYEQVLEFAATAIARHVADRLESRWQDGR